MSSESSNALQPEYRKAVDTLCAHLPHLRPVAAPESLPTSISEQGNICMFEGIIPPSRIPAHDASWRWNQSKSKRTVRLTSDEKGIQSIGRVEVMKLIPRRRASHVTEGSTSAPSFKLWLFYHYPSASASYSIFWCEKGVDMAAVVEPPPDVPVGSSPTKQDNIDRSSFFSVVLS